MPSGTLHHPRDRRRPRRRRRASSGPGASSSGSLRGDHHEHAVAGEHVVDQLDRALLADRQRRQRVGERRPSRAAAAPAARRAARAAAPTSTAAVGRRAGDLDHRARHVVARRADLDRHAARARLRLGERQLDAQDAVLVDGLAPRRRRRRRRARSIAPERAVLDLDLLVDAALGVLGRRRWPVITSSRPWISSAERRRVDAGQLGLHDGARRVVRVVDVDRRREAAAPARRGRCARRRRRTARPSRAACARSWRTGRARETCTSCRRSTAASAGQRGSDRVDRALARDLDRAAEGLARPRSRARTARRARRRCG